MEIIDRKLLEETGLCKKYTFSIDDSINNDIKLPKKLLIELISIVTDNDEVIQFGTPRVFVPSFDKDKEEDELILAWSNKDEENKTDIVEVKGKVIISKNEVNWTGKGYKSVTFAIWEFPETEVKTDE